MSGMLQKLIESTAGTNPRRIVVLFDDGDKVGTIIWGLSDDDHEVALSVADKLARKYGKAIGKALSETE